MAQTAFKISTAKPSCFLIQTLPEVTSKKDITYKFILHIKIALHTGANQVICFSRNTSLKNPNQ